MRKLFVFIFITVSFISCKKESIIVYETTPTTVQSAGSIKNNVKSTVEFISIAYSDLFGTSISQSDLTKLNTVYTSFGDKKLIEDRIILNMLNSPGLQIPTTSSINGDTSQFVAKTFKKFYNRDPNAFEVYYLKEQIRLNSAMTPLVIYYSMMTSDEYRYY